MPLEKVSYTERNLYSCMFSKTLNAIFDIKVVFCFIAFIHVLRLLFDMCSHLSCYSISLRTQ